jgi:hypothetical protein
MSPQVSEFSRSRRLGESDVPDPALAKGGAPHQLSFRNALLIYTILFFALIHPFWLFGEVVVPYRLASEIGSPPASTSSSYVENRKFSDYWLSSIPTIRDHIQAPRSGSLALWVNQNALGRAPLHVFFSPAYAPVWLISKITSNPFRLLTLISLGTCFLAGLFVLLLCKELSLAPIAGLIAGGSVAASPFMMYWLTFPMFLSVICWSAGCLYALARLARQVDLAGCAVLAFSAYSMLMMGYPQAVVHQAYILAGYMAWHIWRRARSTGMASAARYLAVVATAGAACVLLVLPVYLDLARITADSARVSPEISFFLAAAYKIDSVDSALRFFALSTFPEITGNPVSPSFPLTYNGVSVTALVLFFAFFSLLQCWRETWGWWLATVLLCAFALVLPLYAFGVRYMGFNLSRGPPLGAVTLPLTIILAYGVHGLARQFPFEPAAARLAASGTLACLGVVLGAYWSAGLDIRWNIVLATMFVVCLLCRWCNSFRTTSLIGALIVTGGYVSFPLMVRQPPVNLIPTSSLVDRVRASTPPDSRFAIAVPVSAVLPPNMNGIYDVASIHSYDSLSSRRYQALIGELGGQLETYGRLNETIAPDYGSQAFWMSNISLVMSATKLSHPNLEHIDDEGTVHLYRVVSRMGCCLQTALPDQTGSADIKLPDQRGVEKGQPLKTRDEGDLVEIRIDDQQASLLVLSQRYDSNWHATVRTLSGWAPARTAPVNGVFQGVILPAGTQTVRLQFVAFARFAWISSLVWLLVLVLLAVQTGSSRLRRTTKGQAGPNPSAG